MGDDDLAKVVRKLRQSTTADAVVADAKFFARLLAEVSAPLPALPDDASPREVYFHVRLQNLRAHALRLLDLLA
ncbi:hypothetical protein QWJ07_32895 [Frankia sp. RB7]|nr:hypothetical protein [Frankia sp. RB7]